MGDTTPYLQRLIDHVPSMLAYWDQNLQCRFANRAYERWFGVNPELLIGRSIRELLGPELFALNEPYIKAALQGEEQTFERAVPGPDGVTRQSVANYFPDIVDGKVVGFMATVTEVTQLKAAESALRDSEERQKRALDASGLVLWDLDIRTGKLFLTENWAALLGDPKQPIEATLETLARGVLPEDQSAVVAAMSAALKGESQHYEVEHRLRRRDGSTIWIHSEGRVTKRDERGAPVHAAGTSYEVTSRKRSEEQLKRFAALTTATLESTADGILVVSNTRESVLFNGRFLIMWGVPRELAEQGERALLEVASDQVKGREAFLARIKDLYAEPEAESLDDVELKDGRVFERFSRPMIQDGKATGRVWSFRDVTAAREAQSQIERARKAAEAANRAKGEFLATVSHEIRTPLNGVLGLTKLLLAEPLEPNQRKYAELIDSSGESLLHLLNDVLDLQKVESGRFVLEVAAFGLSDLLDELGELFMLRASEKNLVFSKAIAPEVPSWVLGDSNRLRQILNNLLGNALKFTHAGEISLSVDSIGVRDGAHDIRFSIRDTGIGIPSEALPGLFARFVQAEDSTARQYGGTGLGLAIVKQLAEQMGGHVGVSSTPGKGSTFYCEIPLKVTESVPKPRESQGQRPSSRKERILVVDDNPVNHIVASGLLRHLGFLQVARASDGAEAVEAVKEGNFALVFMDCNMPVLDGYAATRQLRASGEQVPVIAMTAAASPEDRQQCLGAGMDDYLTKPLEKAKLAQLLDRYLPKATQIEPAGDSSSTGHSTDSSPAVFERQAVLHRLANDVDMMNRVVAHFVDDSERMVGQLFSALQRSDIEEVHRHLHTLAGSSATAGAAAVYERVRTAEQCALRNDLAAVSEQLAGLKEALAAFAIAVQP